MGTEDKLSAEGIVVTTECKTAEEFLGRLSPQDSFWQPAPPAWIFRGHARAEWSLLSTAHRCDVRELKKWGIVAESDKDLDDDWVRQGAEFRLWHSFRQALDEAGLGIPTTPVEIDSPEEAVFMNEISSEGIPLLALAQHFGLPTSLLDWTRIATKAAYFAASDIDLEESDQGGRLAVWALRADTLKSAKPVDSSMVRVVYAPLASNPNLHAQSGIFTQARAGEVTTVDNYIREHFSEHPEKAEKIPLPWMRKITLPRRCAPTMMRLLSYAGINGSSMFPGYAGVVRRLREEAIWKK